MVMMNPWDVRYAFEVRGKNGLGLAGDFCQATERSTKPLLKLMSAQRIESRALMPVKWIRSYVNRLGDISIYATNGSSPI